MKMLQLFYVHQPKRLKRTNSAVITGIMDVKEAAIKHRVPKTTLKDRLRDRVIHGTKSGSKQYLNNEEEKE